MSTTSSGDLAPALTACFADLKDPRRENSTDYPLDEIIVLTICAVICGAGGFVSITSYGGGSKEGKAALHMVSAWASENRLALGQVKTEEKSNEITAVPELLEVLDVSGCIVTIDAMGCQKDITEAITEQEADYVPALKDNHCRLRVETEAIFERIIGSYSAQRYFVSNLEAPDPEKILEAVRTHWHIENKMHWV